MSTLPEVHLQCMLPEVELLFLHERSDSDVGHQTEAVAAGDDDYLKTHAVQVSTASASLSLTCVSQPPSLCPVPQLSYLALLASHFPPACGIFHIIITFEVKSLRHNPNSSF